MGIGLIGDLPIFVGHESADVWSHQELFQLDDKGRPVRVSGYPPDRFNSNGQRWGHPQYQWSAHQQLTLAGGYCDLAGCIVCLMPFALTIFLDSAAHGQFLPIQRGQRKDVGSNRPGTSFSQSVRRSSDRVL